MSSTASPVEVLTPKERLEARFEEFAELAGQRNAIDGRLVEIIAEIDGDQLWGGTGCRSIAALVAWKLGVSPGTAQTMTTVAGRLSEFPRCVESLRAGRLSLDQVAVIAGRAGAGSDEHYEQLARVATVTQLRTAVKLEPRPEPTPTPRPARPAITKHEGQDSTSWRITLPHTEAAMFDAALASHLEALVTAWKHDHDTDSASAGASAGAGQGDRPPFPDTYAAFLRLVQASWDAEAARRPHHQHSTVVMHFDVDNQVGALHLGPVLTDAERQYLSCDATYEVWFERAGQVIGAGRSTRQINRRLRRALEHRDRTCVVPGCGASRGLHAHHIVHWENGGLTELANLVLVCPYHHREHHRGQITITGTADALVITDRDGDTLTGASLARPPTGPRPEVPPCPGPLGERADWWWYTPWDPSRN